MIKRKNQEVKNDVKNYLATSCLFRSIRGLICIEFFKLILLNASRQHGRVGRSPGL